MTQRRFYNTGTREKVLKFLKDCRDERGYPPSYVEIMENCDISGPSHVKYILDQLEDLGYIERGSGHREITVKDPIAG